MKITDERLAEMVGAGVPCVPAQPGEIAAVVQELRALRAASITPPAPEPKGEVGVEVRTLVWRSIRPEDSDVEADTSIGIYTLSFDAPTAGGAVNLWVPGDDADTFTVYESRKAAKAAAQADYEQRIRSALEPTSVQKMHESQPAPVVTDEQRALDAASATIKGLEAEIERLRAIVAKDPKTVMIAYEDGDHMRLSRAAANERKRADMAEIAENEAKDCFWSIYPRYLELGGAPVSTALARTELVQRIEAAEAERDALRKALEPFADAVFNDNGDMTVNLAAPTSEDFINAYFALRAALKGSTHE